MNITLKIIKNLLLNSQTKQKFICNKQFKNTKKYSIQKQPKSKFIINSTH